MLTCGGTRCYYPSFINSALMKRRQDENHASLNKGFYYTVPHQHFKMSNCGVPRIKKRHCGREPDMLNATHTLHQFTPRLPYENEMYASSISCYNCLTFPHILLWL